MNERRAVSQKATILVIDDEEAIRDSCCQVLSKDGYVTGTAENGHIGLRKIREVKPELVLIDLKMPRMGGMELLEKIGEIDDMTEILHRKNRRDRSQYYCCRHYGLCNHRISR